MMKFVPKGWGYERWIVNKELYCGKLLYIAKDRKCSLHYHKNKDEVFYLHSGKIKVFYSDSLDLVASVLHTYETTPSYQEIEDTLDKVILEPGENFYIPPGRIHMMLGLQNSELFEFSTFHEDSDSFKLIKGD